MSTSTPKTYYVGESVHLRTEGLSSVHPDLVLSSAVAAFVLTDPSGANVGGGSGAIFAGTDDFYIDIAAPTVVELQLIKAVVTVTLGAIIGIDVTHFYVKPV